MEEAQNKKTKKRKTMLIVTFEILIFILIIVSLSYFTPKMGGINKEDKAVFFKFTNAHAILIDDNPDFTSPEKISDKVIKLKPGSYYWKAVGILGESETGNFTVNSEVIINIEIDDGETTVTNQGNVPVNATKKQGGVIIGNMIIEMKDKEVFGNEENITIEARQND